MKCPYCEEELRVPGRAMFNMETYGKNCKVRTECCGKIVHMWPIVSYGASKYDPQPKEDDWGN